MVQPANGMGIVYLFFERCIQTIRARMGYHLDLKMRLVGAAVLRAAHSKSYQELRSILRGLQTIGMRMRELNSCCWYSLCWILHLSCHLLP